MRRTVTAQLGHKDKPGLLNLRAGLGDPELSGHEKVRPTPDMLDALAHFRKFGRSDSVRARRREVLGAGRKVERDAGPSGWRVVTVWECEGATPARWLNRIPHLTRRGAPARTARE